MEKKEITIDLEKFIYFHKQRIILLEQLEKEKKHGRLIFQISFLGFESLAKVLYPKENSSKKRFIDLLEKAIGGIDAKRIYEDWRNTLIHQGFVSSKFTTLECWGDDDISFISFPETNSIRASVEYPPMSIIGIYKNLIDYVDHSFKKENTMRKITITY